MKKNIAYLALAACMAIASVAVATPASAQDILIDVSITPVYEKSAPVDAVAAIPGTPGPGSVPDFYKAPNGEKTATLNRNQCWVSEPGGRKTAGTQGANQVCVWNNGSISSMGGGGRPGVPGRAAIPGVYGQGWAGLDIPAGSNPLDFSHEHDLIHEHECTGSSAPTSC